MHQPALARRDAANHLGAVIDGCLRVETGFASGEALKQDSRVLIHQNAHALDPRAASTTLSAASRIPSATVKLKPDVLKISCPFSTFVPSMRTTIGAFTLSSLAAFTTPVASTSQ